MRGLFLIVLLSMSPAWIGSQKVQKTQQDTPLNIILMIGDGMGISQITAGLIANGNKLNLERMRHIGLIKTFSYDNLITDSAAGATAFACGEKTINGAIAVTPRKKSMPTILEMAHQQGLATGVVATSYIQHATPASFYAHQPNRSMYEDITKDFLNETVDIAIGGGRRFFEDRRDKTSLLDTLATRGYEVFRGIKKAQKNAVSNKVFVICAREHMAAMKMGRGNFLSTSTDFAMERLGQNEKGFFLMVEGSQIDWGGHANDKSYIVDEVIDFDKAVGRALDFAEAQGNTLVIVTADHETGGFAVEGGSFIRQEVIGDFTTGSHTADLIPVFAYGPGAENFMGIYDNTEIFSKMVAQYGFSLPNGD
ncbi:MAG: alkaline phosphatase [Bacteroidota bacterium]